MVVILFSPSGELVGGCLSMSKAYKVTKRTVMFDKITLVKYSGSIPADSTIEDTGGSGSAPDNTGGSSSDNTDTGGGSDAGGEEEIPYE